LIEKLCQIKIHLYTKKENRINQNCNAVIIMNHRTRLDWLFFFCVLRRLEGLKNIKIILKRDLRNIPGPGM
jgi:lysocardiolipin and lysophospholipid acyltransferase